MVQLLCLFYWVVGNVPDSSVSSVRLRILVQYSEGGTGAERLEGGGEESEDGYECAQEKTDEQQQEEAEIK